jgi:hypothetical protein
MLEGIAIFALCMLVPWIGWLALSHIVPAVQIWWKHRWPAEITYEPVAPGALPPELMKAYLSADRALEAAGFDRRECAIVHGMEAASSAEFFEAMWTRAQGEDPATFSGMRMQAPSGAVLNAAYVMIETRYADGRALRTQNSPLAENQPPPQGTDRLICPEITDVRRLLDVHEARKRAASASGPPVRETRSPIDYLRDDNLASLRAALERGTLRFDERVNKYRPTLRGALRVAIPSAWPWRNMITNRSRERTAAALRELGFDESGNRLPIAELAAATTQATT